MNPGLERTFTGLLPHFSANVKTVSATAEAVSFERTISTSAIIGAGLKKCIPTKCCGRFKTLPILFKSIDEVFVAKITSSASSNSNLQNTSCLIAISSIIASITSLA